MQTRLSDLITDPKRAHYVSPEKRLYSKRAEAAILAGKDSSPEAIFQKDLYRRDILERAERRREQTAQYITLPAMSQRLQSLRQKDSDQRRNKEQIDQSRVFFEAYKLHSLLAGNPEIFKQLTSSEASLAQSGMKQQASSQTNKRTAQENVQKTRTSLGESPTELLKRALKRFSFENEKKSSEKDETEKTRRSSFGI